MIHNVAIVGCGYWGPNLIRNFFVGAYPGAKPPFTEPDKDNEK